jgi:hypothetical protein
VGDLRIPAVGSGPGKFRLLGNGGRGKTPRISLPDVLALAVEPCYRAPQNQGGGWMTYPLVMQGMEAPPVSPIGRAAISLGARPRQVFVVCLSVQAILSALHTAMNLVPPLLGESRWFWGLAPLFDLGREANVPTYWSSALLALGSGLLFVAYLDARGNADAMPRYWLVLAIGLAYMSVDETAQIHEGVIGTQWANRFGRGTGIFHYVWYIPFLPALAMLGWAYSRFLVRLPEWIRYRLIAAGAIYLSGAMGMEMVESMLVENREVRLLGASQLVEENLELLGVGLLVKAMLLWLARREALLELRFDA